MEIKTMLMDDVIISRKFKANPPREHKLSQCREYFKQHGTVDKPITVNQRGFLMDGYVRYLVLQENNVKYVNAFVNHTKAPTYVFGRHQGKSKLYCWAVTRQTKGIEHMRIGNKMIVNTKRGVQSARIVRIAVLDEPPKDIVKSVVEFLDE